VNRDFILYIPLQMTSIGTVNPDEPSLVSSRSLSSPLTTS